MREMMNKKHVTSVNTTFNKHKPFMTPISCCNPWREFISHPFSESSVILGIDINSISDTICVFKTDLHGNPSNLTIDVTHWMELGDICKPGARKCRWISPEEQEVRNQIFWKENISFLWNIIRNLLSAVALFYIIMLGLGYTGKTILYSHVIDKIGSNVSGVIKTYKGK
jgi:hypothetical protein